MGPKKSYAEKLKDPRWQKRRLRILERDGWACRVCGDTESTLHVHHVYYESNPWDVPDDALRTLCEWCHDDEHHGRPRTDDAIRRATRRMPVRDAAVLAHALDVGLANDPGASSDVLAVVEALFEGDPEVVRQLAEVRESMADYDKGRGGV